MTIAELSSVRGFHSSCRISFSIFSRTFWGVASVQEPHPHIGTSQDDPDRLVDGFVVINSGCACAACLTTRSQAIGIRKFALDRHNQSLWDSCGTPARFEKVNGRILAMDCTWR